jgi:hypothetical protein
VLQRRHLFRRQVPPFTRSELAIAERSDLRPPQLAHGMSDSVQHAAHLPIAALANGHEQDPFTIVRPLVEQDHLRWLRPAPVKRDSAAQPIDRIAIGHSGDVRFVRAFDPVPRVREHGGEIAVVGEQEESLGVEVETSDRVDVLANAADEIHDRASPLRIGARGHVSRRLVQQDVAQALGPLDAPSVHADVIARRIGFRAHLEDRRAIHRHTAFGNQPFGRAPRRDARVRKDFLKSVHGDIALRL